MTLKLVDKGIDGLAWDGADCLASRGRLRLVVSVQKSMDVQVSCLRVHACGNGQLA